MKQGVSVIIPVYKVEAYLERCIDSVLNQTLDCMDIILVDDGSPDRCGEICDAYSKENEKVITVHKKNEGLGKARNSGLLYAGREYVAFLDSDDYVEPNMYELLYQTAKEENADFVGSGEWIDGKNGQEKRIYVKKRKNFKTKQEMNELLFGMIGSRPEDAYDARYGMSVWKNLYKRELLVREKIQFVSEREWISEDILFNMECLFHSKKAVMLPDCLYHYCLNGSSLSKVYREDRFEQDLRLYEEIRRRLRQWELEQAGSFYVRRLLISRGRYNAIQEVLLGNRDKKFIFLHHRLLKICGHHVFREAIKGYPIWKLPKQQALFAECMKNRWTFVQIFLIKMKGKRERKNEKRLDSGCCSCDVTDRML